MGQLILWAPSKFKTVTFVKVCQIYVITSKYVAFYFKGVSAAQLSKCLQEIRLEVNLKQEWPGIRFLQYSSILYLMRHSMQKSLLRLP